MFFQYNLFGIVWGFIILVLSLVPNSELPDVKLWWDIIQFDKLLHIFIYGVFVLLLIIGFKKQYSYQIFRYNATKYAFITGCVYGIIIEFFQELVSSDRNSDSMDVLANFTGCILAVILFYCVYGKKLTE